MLYTSSEYSKVLRWNELCAWISNFVILTHIISKTMIASMCLSSSSLSLHTHILSLIFIPRINKYLQRKKKKGSYRSSIYLWIYLWFLWNSSPSKYFCLSSSLKNLNFFFFFIMCLAFLVVTNTSPFLKQKF